MKMAYALDSRHEVADEHHAAIAGLLNPLSLHRIRNLVYSRYGCWPFRKMLDVGSGRGSFASRLATEADPSGTVIALDICPPYELFHPNVHSLQHDVSLDMPIPGGPYELIHARLLLAHLDDRQAVLDRLVAALSPGGLIVVEDWHRGDKPSIVSCPTEADARLYRRYYKAVGQVFGDSGFDGSWALRIHSALAQSQLTDVTTVVAAAYWRGGGAGCRVLAATVPQLEGRLHDAGMSPDDLTRVGLFLRDPRTVLYPHTLHSAAGWKAR